MVTEIFPVSAPSGTRTVSCVGGGEDHGCEAVANDDPAGLGEAGHKGAAAQDDFAAGQGRVGLDGGDDGKIGVLAP